MRYKKLNKKNITQLLIEIQDLGDLTANAIATRAVKEYGLQPEHQKQTGNPESAYKQPTAGDDQRSAQPVDDIAPMPPSCDLHVQISKAHAEYDEICLSIVQEPSVHIRVSLTPYNFADALCTGRKIEARVVRWRVTPNIQTEQLAQNTPDAPDSQKL